MKPYCLMRFLIQSANCCLLSKKMCKSRALTALLPASSVIGISMFILLNRPNSMCALTLNYPYGTTDSTGVKAPTPLKDALTDTI